MSLGERHPRLKDKDVSDAATVLPTALPRALCMAFVKPTIMRGASQRRTALEGLHSRRSLAGRWLRTAPPLTCAMQDLDAVAP